MSRFSNFLRNSSIYLFMFLYLEIYFLKVTVSLLLHIPCSQWCPVSYWGCVWVALLIVDPPLLYCEFCIRSGVTRCTLLMVLYLDLMCECELLAVLWSVAYPALLWSGLYHGALVAYQYIYAPPRCRTVHYHRTLILLSVSIWKDLAKPVFDGVGLAGFKSRASGFLLT